MLSNLRFVVLLIQTFCIMYYVTKLLLVVHFCTFTWAAISIGTIKHIIKYLKLHKLSNKSSLIYMTTLQQGLLKMFKSEYVIVRKLLVWCVSLTGLIMATCLFSLYKSFNYISFLILIVELGLVTIGCTAAELVYLYVSTDVYFMFAYIKKFNNICLEGTLGGTYI